MGITLHFFLGGGGGNNLKKKTLIFCQKSPVILTLTCSAPFACPGTAACPVASTVSPSAKTSCCMLPTGSKGASSCLRIVVGRISGCLPPGPLFKWPAMTASDGYLQKSQDEAKGLDLLLSVSFKNLYHFLLMMAYACVAETWFLKRILLVSA